MLNASFCCREEYVYIYTPAFNLTPSVDACFSMEYRMSGDDEDVLFVCTINNTIEIECGDYLWEEEDPAEDTWQNMQIQLHDFGRHSIDLYGLIINNTEGNLMR